MRKQDAISLNTLSHCTMLIILNFWVNNDLKLIKLIIKVVELEIIYIFCLDTFAAATLGSEKNGMNKHPHTTLPSRYETPCEVLC